MLTLRTFSIYRLAVPGGEDPGSKKRSFQAIGANISGFLDTASAEFAALVDGEFGKTFSLFSDDLDTTLTIGDRLIDSENSQNYDVKGVLRNLDGPARKVQATLTLNIDA